MRARVEFDVYLSALDLVTSLLGMLPLLLSFTESDLTLLSRRDQGEAVAERPRSVITVCIANTPHAGHELRLSYPAGRSQTVPAVGEEMDRAQFTAVRDYLAALPDRTPVRVVLGRDVAWGALAQLMLLFGDRPCTVVSSEGRV